MADTFELSDSGEVLPAALAETNIPGLRLIARGKVRDIYDLDDRLLIIATDRLSAFDCVLGTPIQQKGRVLTQLSLFWFEFFAEVVDTHFLTTDLSELNLPTELARHLEGRSMIVRKAEALPVECVARGYLIGSGWKEYQANGTVCGIALPSGLPQAAKLEQPIFTPATKAESGHDENIPFAAAAEFLGADTAAEVRDLTLKLYQRAADFAREKGIIIADTKFEFGKVDGKIILIDEALTPDSSRFWPATEYRTGISPPSYDKQFVRDWLEQKSGWNKQPPAPSLPDEVAAKTTEKYVEAYEKITGQKLA